jgi:hypothetical protein
MSPQALTRARGPAPWLADPDAIPPLPALHTPTVQIALPDGLHTTLPGALWPNPEIWALSDQADRRAPAPIEIRPIKRKESNALIRAWGTHALGAERRPFGYTAFALFVLGEPIAVATAGTAQSASVDKPHGLHRANVIELTRLCRSEHPRARGCLRIMLRAWRDFLATGSWGYYPDTEVVALIAYSMPGRPGHVYRTDGWVRLRDCKPWAGAGTWSRGSRTGSHPEALWVYWLPDAQRRRALPTETRPASQGRR